MLGFFTNHHCHASATAIPRTKPFISQPLREVVLVGEYFFYSEYPGLIHFQQDKISKTRTASSRLESTAAAAPRSDLQRLTWGTKVDEDKIRLRWLRLVIKSPEN